MIDQLFGQIVVQLQGQSLVVVLDDGRMEIPVAEGRLVCSKEGVTISRRSRQSGQWIDEWRVEAEERQIVVKRWDGRTGRWIEKWRIRCTELELGESPQPVGLFAADVLSIASVDPSLAAFPIGHPNPMETR